MVAEKDLEGERYILCFKLMLPQQTNDRMFPSCTTNEYFQEVGVGVQGCEVNDGCR
jgi:hypothetical protein